MSKVDINIPENEKNNSMLSITYLDTIINFLIMEQNSIFKKFLKFFGGYTDISNELSASPFVSIYIYTYNYFYDHLMNKLPKKSEPIKIRISSAKIFNLSAEKYKLDDVTVYDYHSIKTAVLINRKKKIIYCYLSEYSEIAFIELIRDLIIKNQEHHETLILHSAAVERNGKALLICGLKGSGKSTTVMEFIFNNKYNLLSGDKVFIKFKNAKMIIKGWPDYPHLGIGTIKRYPRIREIVGEEIISRSDDKDKILVDFDKFYSIETVNISTGIFAVKNILFPVYRKNEKMRIVENKNIVSECLSCLEFKKDFKYSKWNDYILPIEDLSQLIHKFMNCIINCKGYYLIGDIQHLNKVEMLFKE